MKKEKCMCVTSGVKAEGDQPPESWQERTLYLLEYITLQKQNHTHRSDHTEWFKLTFSSIEWLFSLIHSESLKQI